MWIGKSSENSQQVLHASNVCYESNHEAQLSQTNYAAYDVITLLLGGVQSKVMSVSDCPSARISQR